MRPKDGERQDGLEVSRNSVPRRAFATSAVAGAVVVFALSAWFGRPQPPAPAGEASRSTTATTFESFDPMGLPSDWVKPLNAPNADGGVSREFRALLNFTTSEVGLRVLENPDAFDSVFPGYSELRSNDALWRGYFRETMVSGMTWAPALNRNPKLPIMASGSYLGNLRIYLKAGAEILSFGTSQAYHALVPAQVSEAASAPGPGGRKRFLSLAMPGGTLSEVSGVIRFVSTRKHRVEWALLGFSPSWAVLNRHPTREAGVRPEVALLRGRQGLRKLFDDALAFRPPVIPWSQVFRWHRPLISAPAPVTNEQGVREHLKRHFISFPKGRHEEPGWLDARVTELMGTNVKRVSATVCDLYEHSRALDRVLSELKTVAENVLLYIPPTHPLLYRGMPECLLPRIRQLLESKVDDRVRVFLGDAGVRSEDFVFPFTEARDQLNLLHVNFQGASKVSAELARQIVSGSRHSAEGEK